MNNEKEQALNYLAQLANDFINTLPASAKAPTQQMAQNAINVLLKDLEKSSSTVTTVSLDSSKP